MIEFNPSDHTYTYDGTPVPSVTSLIKLMSDDPYSKIPKRNLMKAARYGDTVHELIENYSLGHDVGDVDKYPGFEGIALRRYKKLQEQNEIVITSCEEKLVYIEDGLPLYCGMYDMFGTVKGAVSLIDIKTTAEVHYDLLGYQLPMYKAAIEQMTNAKIERTYCLWLPKKGLGKLIEIEQPVFEDLAPKIHKAYEKFYV